MANTKISQFNDNVTPLGSDIFPIVNGGSTKKQTLSGLTAYISANLVEVFVTGGTYNGGIATFTNNTGSMFSVSGFSTGNTEVFVTGGTYNGGTATFTNNTGSMFSVSGFSTGNTEVYLTGGTYNGGTVTYVDNTGGTFSVSGFSTGTTNISDSIYSVFNNLDANGTTSATTSISKYGVNVFTGVTNINMATKLPQPITGKSVKIINLSSNIMYVFPSNIGGQINNYPINTPAMIPPDGKLYEFICIENPLPGAWTWTTPAINQIVLPEISVSHTQGINTYAYGTGGPQLLASTSQWLTTVNATEFANVITLLPSPAHWRTEPFPALLARTKCYTNFVAADGANRPIIGRHVVYKPASNIFNVYTAGGLSFTNPETVPSGPLNNPIEVGDFGTYYKIQDAPLVQVPPSDTDKIGQDIFSNHYYIFSIRIPPTAATKVYKFQLILEYF